MRARSGHDFRSRLLTSTGPVVDRQLLAAELPERTFKVDAGIDVICPTGHSRRHVRERQVVDGEPKTHVLLKTAFASLVSQS